MDGPTSVDSGHGLVAVFIPRVGKSGSSTSTMCTCSRDRTGSTLRFAIASNSIKLLVERTDDGFERWRTEFDASLPAGPEHFRDVLDLIGRAASPERLGAAARAGDVVEILGHAICDRRLGSPCNYTEFLSVRR